MTLQGEHVILPVRFSGQSHVITAAESIVFQLGIDTSTIVDK